MGGEPFPPLLREDGQEHSLSRSKDVGGQEGPVLGVLGAGRETCRGGHQEGGGHDTRGEPQGGTPQSVQPAEAGELEGTEEQAGCQRAQQERPGEEEEEGQERRPPLRDAEAREERPPCLGVAQREPPAEGEGAQHAGGPCDPLPEPDPGGDQEEEEEKNVKGIHLGAAPHG